MVVCQKGRNGKERKFWKIESLFVRIPGGISPLQELDKCFELFKLDAAYKCERFIGAGSGLLTQKGDLEE